jgi:hypothetical protein
MIIIASIFVIMTSVAFFVDGGQGTITSGAVVSIPKQDTCNQQCTVDTECNDNNACTNDICLNSGTCKAACFQEIISICKDNDNCCPAGCTGKDNDC